MGSNYALKCFAPVTYTFSAPVRLALSAKRCQHALPTKRLRLALPTKRCQHAPPQSDSVSPSPQSDANTPSTNNSASMSSSLNLKGNSVNQIPGLVYFTMDVGSSKPFSPPTPPEVPQAPVHFIHLFLEGDFSENPFGLSAQTVRKLFDLCVQEDLPCCDGVDFVRQRGLEAVFRCDMTEKHANDVIAAWDGRSLFSVRGYGDAFPSCKVRLCICGESHLSESEQEECNVQRSLQ
uniref:Uncharacterized protein n=1 Tax=Chromera velia CCMP2878 TaxID=1169474 RepID=A0A0G4GC60_9ALVE|eukprot:Cvel_21239.t1-p1 / transcript=Cvel_21239.t1 / gene=Cvel_21239 / organism=Chromera_velia_CCMP2878 / gene_product=hypothetical protein / transcript_product=hypothetical protein / location=Cvel_scaffold1975:19205-19906(+) / protein_length=234 / sequence_SO=supercontig / SO=protein_coding / is_pseudo=false